MRRALVAAVVVLAAGGAHAGWQVGSAAGGSTPTDLNLVDAGAVVVASDLGLHAFYTVPDGGTTAGAALTSAGAMVGGRLGPAGCVYGLSSLPVQLVGSTAACGDTTTFIAGTIADDFAVTLSGSGLTFSRNNITRYVFHHGDAGLVGPWNSINHPLAPLNARGVISGVTVAGMDWGVTGHPGALISGAVVRPGASGVAVVYERPMLKLVAFQHGSTPGYLVSFVDGGLALQYDFATNRDAGAVSVPPQGEVRALAFTEVGGSVFGRGFGLAAVEDAGVWGAVPNPASPGMAWVWRPGIAVVSPVAGRCLDAANCVLLSNAAGSTQALSWYFNTSAPASTDGGTIRFAVDAGASFRAALPVADPDGDPIWITWEPDGGALAFTAVAGTTHNEQADFVVPGTLTCGTTSYPFSFRAADGWAPNTRQLTGFVDVTHSVPPGPPTVATSVTLYAGLGSQFVSYAPPTTGCPATSSNAAPSGNGFTATAIDGGYLFAPDLTFCSLDGGGALTITNSNDAGSSVATVTVAVVPWGTPGAGPFTPGPSVQFDAGSDVELALATSHACGLSPGFPGVDLLWTHDGGAAVAVTRTADGGFRVQSLDACVAAQFALSAQAVVRGEDAGRVSSPATVNLAAIPFYPPALASDFGARPILFDAAAAQAYGNLTLSTACAAQRNFDALISIFGTNGALLADAGVAAIPGPWDASVPGGCNGNTFFVRAELREGGVPTGIYETQQVDPTRVQAAVGSIGPDRVPVSCGDDLRFPASAQAAAGACSAQTYYWKQTDGPPVDFSSTEGQDVTISSSAGFDALGGATISLEVSSDAGDGNVGAPVPHLVRLVPAPFVELAHDFEPLPAREGEALPVRAALRNTGGCDVTGLMLEETLGKLQFVQGSARVNGARVEGHATDAGTALIGPIAVGAGKTTHVTWLARAPLSSRPQLSGAVWMGAEPVSFDAPKPPPCSCGTTPLAGAFWALLLVGLAKRRKRCG